MQYPNPDLIKAGRIANQAIEFGFNLIKKYGWVTKSQIDQELEIFIKDNQCSCPLIDYKPPFTDKIYQWTSCISKNYEVVHSPPTNQILKAESDIITIDLVVGFKGAYVDTARTWCDRPNRLVDLSLEVFKAAVNVIAPGLPINIFGKKVEEEANIRGLHVIKELSGHGIGKEIHMPPNIKNYYDPNETAIFEVGNCFAVEPILGLGLKSYPLDHNGDWTISYPVLNSHFEDSLLILSDKVINLTG